MLNSNLNVGFHDTTLVSQSHAIALGHWDTQFTYTFENFFHPFMGELIAKLNRESLPGMLDAKWQESLKTPDPKTDPAHDFFHQLYSPQNTTLFRSNISRRKSMSPSTDRTQTTTGNCSSTSR
jgi:hypothetical protein